MSRKNRKRRSIYWTIIIPLIILLAVEASIIIGIPVFSGVFREMQKNKEDLFAQQVTARRDMLQDIMAKDWANLSNLSSNINLNLSRLAAEQGISVRECIQDQALCEKLLVQITDSMVENLYIKRASGIYVMLNGQNLEPLRQKMPNCSGIYIQDLDPGVPPAKNRRDLRLKRAPENVLEESGIEADPHWKAEFMFRPGENFHNYDFLYTPFQRAYQAKGVKIPMDFGNWCLEKSVWYDHERSEITYSQPLISGDGMVYGVVGIDMLNSHLQNVLPRKELSMEDTGTYILAKMNRTENGLEAKELYLNSNTINMEDLQCAVITGQNMEEDGRYMIRIGGQDYFTAVSRLKVYESERPTEDQQWMILGLVNKNYLYRISNNTIEILGLSVLLTLICGIVGNFIISRKLSVPVQKVSEDAEEIKTEKAVIPKLPDTGIREIDQLSDAIVSLSQDVIHTSTRFLRIIEMATGEIGGFEVKDETLVFVTSNFFTMFGMDVRVNSGDNKKKFLEYMTVLQNTVPNSRQDDGGILYEVTSRSGQIRYIEIRITHNKDTTTGLAEDITALIVERQRIEYDRDYDLLTGLLNRRAFYREVERIFYSENIGKYAAMVMLDLDNLKQTNDKFGHEWGDRYLQKGAFGFVSAAPSQSVLARLGGDEFALFVYGCRTQDELYHVIDQFKQRVWKTSFVSPDGTEHRVQVSGGVACYPRDSRHLQELLKFADFAMYQVKHGIKGELGEFDFGSYSRAGYLAQNRKELQQLLEEELLHYNFQPIFDGRTGEVYAYEALMRVNMPTLKTPDMVLSLAHQCNKLHEIERLTMIKSTEYYKALRKEKLVNPDAYLFINSIADQWIDTGDQQRVMDNCSDFVSKIVIEITECMEIEVMAMTQKNQMKCFSGLFALDDYGTGYNGEKNLLNLNPKFVKLDICLVSGVDSDLSKQHIVANLLSYAHQRNMLVVAEGVETLDEMRKCMELGVDLYQGYVLARPAAIPPQISPEAKNLIEEFWKQNPTCHVS